MRPKIDEEEMYLRIGRALLEAIDRAEKRSQDTTEDEVAASAGLPVARVRDTLERFGFRRFNDGGIQNDHGPRDELEAFLAVQVVPASANARTTNNVSVTGSTGVMFNVGGGEISGSTQYFPISYQEVLEQISDKIKKSDAPSETKKTAINAINLVLSALGKAAAKALVTVILPGADSK